MATFLIYYLKTSWIVWLSFEGNLGHAELLTEMAATLHDLGERGLCYA